MKKDALKDAIKKTRRYRWEELLKEESRRRGKLTRAQNRYAEVVEEIKRFGEADVTTLDSIGNE